MQRLSGIVALFMLALVVPAHAGPGFTVADYHALKDRDLETTHLVLEAMNETVFYAQKSVGRDVICASPVPTMGAHLVDLVEAELRDPSNDEKRSYSKGDHVAFVLIHALRRVGKCE